jgi:hypothetical protein
MGRLVAARGAAGFELVEDLVRRVGPTLNERRVLNALLEVRYRWQLVQPFHEDLLAGGRNEEAVVLPTMTAWERLVADFSAQGATTGEVILLVWGRLQRSEGESPRREEAEKWGVVFCHPIRRGGGESYGAGSVSGATGRRDRGTTGHAAFQGAREQEPRPIRDTESGRSPAVCQAPRGPSAGLHGEGGRFSRNRNHRRNLP